MPSDPPPAAGPLTARLEIPVAPEGLFKLLSDPRNLPSWVDLVKAVSQDAQGWMARYRLQEGVIDCRCDLRLDPAALKVEWTARLPDGRALRASARVQALAGGGSSCELTEDSPPGPAGPPDARRQLEKNLEKLSKLVQGKASGGRP